MAQSARTAPGRGASGRLSILPHLETSAFAPDPTRDSHRDRPAAWDDVAGRRLGLARRQMCMVKRPGFAGGSRLREDGAMGKTSARYMPKVRERAVWMVGDHAADHGSQWAAIRSIAPELGCTAETLRRWVRKAEKAATPGAAARAEEAARVKALERELRELRQANEILREASAYFAPVERDRPLKR